MPPPRPLCSPCEHLQEQGSLQRFWVGNYLWYGYLRGSQSVNFVPSPKVLAAAILPPWASTRALTIASPKPAPPRPSCS